ncbi:MAG: hypothetical protein KatS3mg111_3917 [Pirellulaceae bacterium]|nr:MAG: hypothetical protein KatS3mg111_3917 [Pirellulaceae bacterium]
MICSGLCRLILMKVLAIQIKELNSCLLMGLFCGSTPNTAQPVGLASCRAGASEALVANSYGSSEEPIVAANPRMVTSARDSVVDEACFHPR